MDTITNLTNNSQSLFLHFQKKLHISHRKLSDLVSQTLHPDITTLFLRDFTTLLKHQYPLLIYDDIDRLFHQIAYPHPAIPIQYLEQLLKIQYNPRISINKSLLLLRDALIASNNHLNIIARYDRCREAQLNQRDLQLIFKQVNIKNICKVNSTMKCVLEHRETISICQLLTKLNLNEYFSIIDLSQFQISNQVYPTTRQLTPFIKQHHLHPYQSNHPHPNIPHPQIPTILKPYFNTLSQLTQQFAECAIHYLRNKQIFIDFLNPSYYQATQYVHLSQVMEGQYLNFDRKDQKNTQKLINQFLPSNVHQSYLADCYLLAAISGVVQKHPKIISRLFVLCKNPSHLYGVRLFIDGIWKTIMLDGCFPTADDSFCGIQHHNSCIWVMLLEKAWAKQFKSYDNILWGTNNEALSSLTGAPSFIISTNCQTFFNTIQCQLKQGHVIITISSQYLKSLPSYHQNKIGLFINHSYILSGIFSNLPYHNSTITLLKVRNPWGYSDWHGKWSFNSKNWNPQLRALVNYSEDINDGTFFMSSQEIMLYFDQTIISKVIPQYINSSVEVLGNRYNFTIFEFNVQLSGLYYFTVYQQNQRTYSHTYLYSQSPLWMFLLHKKSQTPIIASRHQNTISVHLNKGKYLLCCKVKWKYWIEHICQLSSYAPTQLHFNLVKLNTNKIISKYISCMSKKVVGRTYTNWANVNREQYFDVKNGYGFVILTNRNSIVIRAKISFLTSGLQLIDCHLGYSPFQFDMHPHKKITFCWLVSEGYSLTINEAYEGVD